MLKGREISMLSPESCPPLYLLVKTKKSSFLRLQHEQLNHAATRNYKATIKFMGWKIDEI